MTRSFASEAERVVVVGCLMVPSLATPVAGAQVMRLGVSLPPLEDRLESAIQMLITSPTRGILKFPPFRRSLRSEVGWLPWDDVMN